MTRKRISENFPARRSNNLKNIDVQIPLTGRSPSSRVFRAPGKSTLVNQICGGACAPFYGAEDVPGKFKRIEGLEFYR